MTAVNYLIIKILFFNNTFLSIVILSFASSGDQEDTSGHGSLGNPFIDFEDEVLRMIDEKIDSVVTTRINLMEEQLKSFIQTELQALKAPKYDLYDKWDKCSKDEYPESCYAIKECRNDVFSIMVKSYSNEPFKAACDFETLNSGWTVIQRRQDGSENFFRNWTDYVKGFGNLHGEFFIGLEKLHALTSNGTPQELYILMEDFEGTRKYAKYSKFIVGPENTNFTLNVEGYSGDAGDSLQLHNGKSFSTKDYGEAKVCARACKGGWWYDICHHSNLNGLYLFGQYSKSKFAQGVNWKAFRGYRYSLKFVQMMIRPHQDDDD